MEGTVCEIICGAPTTLAVKGLMMMMIDDVVGVRRLKKRTSLKPVSYTHLTLPTITKV